MTAQDRPGPDVGVEEAAALRARGDIAGALVVAERLVRERAAAGEDDPAHLRARVEVAWALGAAGAVARAREVAAEAAAGCARVFGAEDAVAAEAAVAEGEARRAAGELAAARGVLAAAARRLEAARGAEDAATVRARFHLALAERDASNWAAARDLLDGVLAARTRTRALGKRHADTLECRLRLVGVRLLLGERSQAKELEACCREVGKALGKDHPLALDAQAAVAIQRYKDGKPAEARAMMEEVLAGLVARLGADHPLALENRGNLAFLMNQQGETAAAIALEEQVLAARRRVLGPEHPETMTSQGNLATRIGKAGDRERARALLEELAALRRRVLGDEHNDTLTTLNNLAHQLVQVGELDRARGIQEEVLAVRRRVLGEEHRSTVIARNNLDETMRLLAERQRRPDPRRLAELFGEAVAQAEATEGEAAEGEAPADEEEPDAGDEETPAPLSVAGEPVRVFLDRHGEACARVAAGPLAPLAGETIRLQFMNCGGSPAPEQLALAARFAAGAVDDLRAVAEAARAEWNRIGEDIDLKQVKRWQDLRGKLDLHTVYIHRNLGDPAGLRYGYGGNWDEADPEHAFGALVQGGVVREVGHQSVAFSDDSPEAETAHSRKQDLARVERMLATHRASLERMRGIVAGTAAPLMPGLFGTMMAEMMRKNLKPEHIAQQEEILRRLEARREELVRQVAEDEGRGGG